MSALDLQGAGPVSPAAKLKDAFHKLKRSRIRISSVHTTRASSVGNDCERFLVYERTAGELRKPHDERTQALFDLGNHAERFVVAELASMGIDVLERARDYHDRELELTGHIDGKLVIDGVERPVPAEIKGLNPFTAERIETIDDIKNSQQGWVRKYYAQLQVYLHLDKSPLGVFVILNKVSGGIEFIDCPYDPVFADELMRKVRLVRDAVHANTLPERRESSECARCPFLHVCMPDRTYGEAVKILDEPELIAAIAKRESLRDAKRDFDEADRAVKAYLPETAAELLVGPYAVLGKEIQRKAYSVKAGSYVRWDVRQLSPDPVGNWIAAQKPLNPNPTPKSEAKENDDAF